MKKYLMSLAALMIAMTATMLTSCSNNELGEIVNPEVETPQPGTHVETLTIAFPDQTQTRVAMDGSYNLTGWELGDKVTLVRTYYEESPEGEIFNVEETYTFTCTNAANGTFTGTIDDGYSVEDCQLAFYNATGFDTDGQNTFYFSPKSRVSQNMKDVVMLVAKNDGGNFEMEIFGSILQVTNNTGADITASVKYSWDGYGRYYDCSQIYCNYSDFDVFGTDIGANLNHQITLSKDAPTYVYIPVFDLTGGDEDFAVGLSAEGDAANVCSIVPFKTNPSNAKLFKKTLEAAAAWENPLSLGVFDDDGPSNIEIQTGVDVSSYTEDATHKPLNAAGTLWEVLDGNVLKIQTSLNKIKGREFDEDEWMGVFDSYWSVQTITGLDKLDMSGVKDMTSMFAGCESLTALDLSSWNTSNATSMNGMFAGCRALETINIANFNTSNVTNMSGMFSTCAALTTLDLSNLNTSNVTDMSWMFARCTALTTLNLNSWNTSNVTTMDNMFEECKSLLSLTLSDSFNPCNAMFKMFYKCNTSMVVHKANNAFKEATVNDGYNGWGSSMSFAND